MRDNKCNIRELVEEYYKSPEDYFVLKEKEFGKNTDENATSQNAENNDKSGERHENNVNIPIKEGQESK